MRLARELGPGKTVVTILCDGGSRYQSKLFNPAFLREKRMKAVEDKLSAAVAEAHQAVGNLRRAEQVNRALNERLTPMRRVVSAAR